MSRPVACAVALLLLLNAGCTHRTVNNQEITIGYESWVPIMFFVIGLAFLAAGWFSRKLPGMPWYLLIPVGVLFLVLTFTIGANSIRVTNTEFEVHEGAFGLGTDYRITYDELSSIDVVKVVNYGRRTTTTYNLLYRFRSGKQESYTSIGTLIRVGLPDLITRAGAGVAVSSDLPEE